MKRIGFVAAGLLLAACTAVFVTPLIGLDNFSPAGLLHDEYRRFIFLSIRIPRMLTAFFAGGGLAVCGMIYQAVFRNPLADPFTLGVSGGASLGAAICIAGGIGGSMFGISATTLGAFAGAVLSVAVVYGFTLTRQSHSNTILLAGVVVATFCLGGVMFIHVVAGVHKSYQILRWIMGGVDGVNFTLAAMMTIPLLLFFAVAAVFMPQLDLLLTGDSIAHSRGVNIQRSRIMFITMTAFAIGSIVAVCGPIGFVGIIAPHVCRLILPGIRHRILAACSFLLGGSILVFADTLARSIAPPTEIPVGIITSLLGGPFFLVILFRMKNRLWM